MKLGSYIIPDLRLFPKILGDVKILYESYQCSEVENPTAAANLLGHKSANSGSWHSKLADMRLYGLLEPRKIQVTKLAEILTYGTEEEKQDAMIQAIMKVPLWKTLFDDFGENLTNEYFWAQLQKITGVSPLEAQKHADFVRNAYLKDISNIKSELGIRSKDSDIPKKVGSSEHDKSKITIQAGEFSQQIPYSLEGIELAKGFLDLLGRQLEKKNDN